MIILEGPSGVGVTYTAGHSTAIAILQELSRNNWPPYRGVAPGTGATATVTPDVARSAIASISDAISAFLPQSTGMFQPSVASQPPVPPQGPPAPVVQPWVPTWMWWVAGLGTIAVVGAGGVYYYNRPA